MIEAVPAPSPSVQSLQFAPVELARSEHRPANIPASRPDIRIEIERGGVRLKLPCAARAGPAYAALLGALADTMAVV